MNRRNHIKKLGVLSAAPLFANPIIGEDIKKQGVLELRRYKFSSENNRSRFHNYMKNVYIPTLNQLGIRPIGAFAPIYVYDSYAAMYLLIPFDTVKQAFQLNQQLQEDAGFKEKTKEFDDMEQTIPLYHSYTSTIMSAFSNFPGINIPEICKTKKRRYFNLRTYKSHSHVALQKKIDMFNTDGEIEMHKKMGYEHIFFGEAIFGDELPNMSYMHVWEDLEEYEELMHKFWNSPDFVELRNRPKYKNTTYDGFSILLQPLGYSQI
jgi:hypothetical protein